ncbi:hypothetical protein SEA_SEPHIROTH_71 [Gordonia Phage Sephiroth]|uniref:DUF6915 domain-containing protein n=2 Tax=Octobienvirus TaxID=3044779 RepID=A0AAE8Y664_9CAUD|nr:hypothetical protein L3Y23_gp071 [Gordonia Phage Sephiroth]YP_010246591.1 hypothetical protein L3Y24_gp072 [Gordonia phage Kudefre]QNN99413.1 hypothetical protein SEA_SEPHIROTH_71 [Gordonia Phage Sephiroth]UDL15301.1 hypothetical protein SEA_KUDEFRE_72 [Gordonia phage Kudefre]
MAQSWKHAETSARHFGGKPDDYIAIHEWIDQFKSVVGDVTHRAYLHNSKGPWMAQEVFGRTITNAEGKQILVRDIAENHITEDMGWIPSPADWSSCMTCKVWMGGKRNKFIGREDLLESALPHPNKSRKETDD